MKRFASREWAVIFAVLLGLAGFLFLVQFDWPRPPSGRPIATAPPPESEPLPDRTRPLAVMIDNHPNARPQSGLATADVIWEAPVEGGLTRTMAIFRSASATEIGPVRSARPYFMEWAGEANAVYVHVGGSDEALAQLAAGRLPLDDANEFSNGATFWRDSRRSAPHNTYTSSARVRALMEKKGWKATTEAVDATRRSREAATGTPATAVSVTAVFGADPYAFHWQADAGGYALWRRGRAMRDRDGTPIVPRTVVALEMDVTAVPDPKHLGLIGFASIGSGPATVFRDGVAVPGTWKKTSITAPTLVYDAQGALIPFARGQVWYAVIGTNRGGEVAVE